MTADDSTGPRKADRLPIRIDRSSDENLQIQIFKAIQSLITSGRLKPGTPLPSFREMSEQLGVSKNTVILACERLICEGYLVTHPGRGTYVSPHLPEQALRVSQRAPTARERAELLARRHPTLFQGQLHAIFNPARDKARIDFVVGRPDADSFPAALWKQLAERKIAHGQAAMTQYREPAGLGALRQAIADHLGPARGMNVAASQVIITGGIQEALNLIARLLISPDTRVAIESPCYQGAAYVLKSVHADIVPVPVDEAGLIVDHLPDDPVSVIYVTPSHQYPLGGTLPLKRRFELLEWAWETGAYIVEDDYDSDFRYQGSPLFSLAGLDRHDSVIYLGTFSKSVGAGIRTGYIVAPPALAEKLGVLKGLLDNGNPWLDQAVLTEFIESGAFYSYLRRMRQIYQSRQRALIEALEHHFGAADVLGIEGGMHLIWRLPSYAMPAPELAARARNEGVGIYPLAQGAAEFIATDAQRARLVMLGFTSLDAEAIREGVRILAGIITLDAAEREGRGVAAGAPVGQTLS